MKPFIYNWQWELDSPPEVIWKFISDTNRFNFETGVPPVKRTGELAPPFSQTLQLNRFGYTIAWEEEPFTWIYPERYSVLRKYRNGPLKKMEVQVALSTTGNGGTSLLYTVIAEPASILGFLAIPFQIGFLSKNNFEKVIRKYDRQANRGNAQALPVQEQNLKPVSTNLKLRAAELEKVVTNRQLLSNLCEAITTEDDISLAKMRAYAYAKKWGLSLKETLEAFLYATRFGILDLRWEILCPFCRGSQKAATTLKEVHSPFHCSSCNIDFNVNFHQLVEITFTPNPAIRNVEAENYCIGGPQVTPHIVVQQMLLPGESKIIPLRLEEGAYRLRTNAIPNGMLVHVNATGLAFYTARSDGKEFLESENCLAPQCSLEFENSGSHPQLFIFERLAWADDSVTASEITALQVFRDLYANEALRPGEQISVGSVTLLFTDLKNSTMLYRKIGDAVAFGMVMDHFAILKECISGNNGALVKTIGDAIMAVFINPADAVKAITTANDRMRSNFLNQQLLLKAGIHFGPCIGVNLNDLFDYFGSTVNIAARLEGLSKGNEIIVSGIIHDDPGVQSFIESIKDRLTVTRYETALKGFTDEQFTVYSFTPH